MKCEVKEGTRYFFFETEEINKICPKCKREYKSRNTCLNCLQRRKVHVDLETNIKQRTGTILKDLSSYSCSCIFSSWFKFGGYWVKNHPKSCCKHMKKALKIIKKGNK